MKTVIIGGVAGGASAAARLRRLDEDAEIILLERGRYISYANCGLPYYIGGVIEDKEALTLQTPESFSQRFRIDVRVEAEAVKIDPDAKTVTVHDGKTAKSYQESYDTLVLSPGAEPLLPPLSGIDSSRVFTLRTIPDTFRIKGFLEEYHPKSAVIAGGGYIGVEMAENLQKAGVQVTVVELSDHIIGPLDYDVAVEVQHHMESNGVHLLLKTGVSGIAETETGLAVSLSDGKTLSCELLLMAAGVRPDTAFAVAAGIAVNAKGSIQVDEHMRTSIPNIYAVGDAVEIINFVTGKKGYIPLAGPANKQGRIAADNICGLNSRYQGTQGSSVLKCFDMTVAMTGINEASARAAGIVYEKSFTFSPSHASYYPRAVNMGIKLLFEQETGKILGAQLTGYDGVDKRCDVIASAIRAHMTVSDLANLELCYAPPYSSAKDPINIAGFTAENILTAKVKVFHWHDIAGLDRSNAILLDVRTKEEYANNHIPGFINIPLDELREHIHELDRGKPVYITCQIGLRGYYAARILMQKGFDCYNLSGGNRLYRTLFESTAPQEPAVHLNPETMWPEPKPEEPPLFVNACGLQCPSPILKLAQAIHEAPQGSRIEIHSTDPAFSADAAAWCRRTGHKLEDNGASQGIFKAVIRKNDGKEESSGKQNCDGKNIIVFSGDLDKAIASFIIANAAASMGRKVSMFFTFWGLNILRKPGKAKVEKDFISRMFGRMMPRGSQKLKLSNMNMLGMGPKMIRGIMKKKNIASLEELIQSALDNGVELVACTMSMDVMGIKMEELVDGVKPGGAAAMLAHAEESDMSLFI